jgi:hypothetical protein
MTAQSPGPGLPWRMRVSHERWHHDSGAMRSSVSLAQFSRPYLADYSSGPLGSRHDVTVRPNRYKVR